eukprot:CAMPEP_0168168478 /NCGR_PEP_ID=MMETSP0139_2-20121125/3113_1 /TAXON_ID=44445 /ORGANISM="Pseudo-nitzschia australis, Strain 10249 10 AB" /LENGTH=280 /DNA_ID=CAMNT_0008085807 /DNA_START=119 /DNA_END=961 /DNA_ORIENTATION=+
MANVAVTNDDRCIQYDTHNDNRITATTIHPDDLNRATAFFERALTLIVRSAEVYRNQGGLQYFEPDNHGMIQFECDCTGAQLIASLNLQDTGVRMNSIDDETFIHCKAVKIGNDDPVREENATFIDESKHDGREYRHLSVSIFHSMICIYNLGLCYQYKGIQTSSRSLLEAAVDHYMQAYELATRFRLQHIDQYTLLMATMNNLATTYSFLNEPARRDVCNNYLLSTLMLLTTSEEGQENHREAIHSKCTQSRARQTTYQGFLSNVMYLISPRDTLAPAA